jgi:hypothetical protein
MDVSDTIRPAPLLHHAFQAAFRQAEHAGQIRGDHRVPVLGLHAQQQRVARDGGVVHQDGGHLVAGIQIG